MHNATMRDARCAVAAGAAAGGRRGRAGRPELKFRPHTGSPHHVERALQVPADREMEPNVEPGPSVPADTGL